MAAFYYGANELHDLYLVDEMREFERKLPNFTYVPALARTAPEDDWQGYTGFIHDVLYENHLKDHPAPEDCEYYMCGPPMMNAAVIQMLEDQGVESDNILLDDFGG